MGSIRARLTTRATMLVALLVVAVALVAGDDGVSGAQTSLNSKIKKLTKKVAQLQTKVAVLELEQGKPRPPSGPAGGDLGGNYPNPQIPLFDGGLGPTEIADGGVQAAEIGLDAVGSSELVTLEVVENQAVVSAGGSNSGVVASCDLGDQLIGGGAWWDFQSGSISASHPNSFLDGWIAAGENEGMANQTLHVKALCLPPAT